MGYGDARGPPFQSAELLTSWAFSLMLWVGGIGGPTPELYWAMFIAAGGRSLLPKRVKVLISNGEDASLHFQKGGRLYLHIPKQTTYNALMEQLSIWLAELGYP